MVFTASRRCIYKGFSRDKFMMLDVSLPHVRRVVAKLNNLSCGNFFDVSLVFLNIRTFNK